MSIIGPPIKVVEIVETTLFKVLKVEKLEKLKEIIGEVLKITKIKEIVGEALKISKVAEIKGESPTTSKILTFLSVNATQLEGRLLMFSLLEKPLEEVENNLKVEGGIASFLLLTVKEVPAKSEITGMAEGKNGASVTLYNNEPIGGKNVLLTNEDIRSEGINQFKMTANLELAPRKSATFVYRGGWLLINKS